MMMMQQVTVLPAHALGAGEERREYDLSQEKIGVLSTCYVFAVSLFETSYGSISSFGFFEKYLTLNTLSKIEFLDFFRWLYKKY